MNMTNSIELTVLGGGGEVGANCFLLNIDGQQVVLDCGTHPKKDGNEALPEFSLLTKAPDAVLISHGHQDHCGSFPYLLRHFPMVRSFSTAPTLRIMDRMLHNSVSVMGLIAKERGISEYPLYDHGDVNYALKGTRTHPYEESFSLGLRVPVQGSFHRAGHVLGSAGILLKMPNHTLFYTGDYCETPQELLPGHKPLRDDIQVDTLIIESTHGNTDEDKVRNYQEEARRLGESTRDVLLGGGAVLIPTFALGRTQEILNIIVRQQEEGLIPDVPVYASGLGRAVYELYDYYLDHLIPNTELCPLDRFERIGNVWNQDTVERLISRPCIIVATSGMMLQNTPSAMIAQAMVKETHHGIFFVGYLDHETLGYHLLHSERGQSLQFTLHKEPVEVHLENIQRFYFSAHAPRKSLANTIERIKPKNVIYVHGDADAIAWMHENTGNGFSAHAPAIGQTLTLKA